MLRDYVLSLIRTWLPIGVGVLVAWLAARGVILDAETSTALVVALGGVAAAVYYALARLLELKFPFLGGLLLGSPKSVPVYVPNPPKHMPQERDLPS